MTAVEELAQTLRSLAAGFAALGCDWAVGGSLASAAYGEPRATNDVDTVARMNEAHARRLGDALGEHFYVPEAAALDAVRHHDSFNVIDERSYMKGLEMRFECGACGGAFVHGLVGDQGSS